MPLLPWNFRRNVCFAAFLLCLLPLLNGCSRLKGDLGQASQLENQEQWPEALAAYNRLLPQIPPRHKSQLAELHSHLGHCLTELGHPSEALATLDTALRLDPNNLDAHLRMAQLLALADAPLRAQSYIDFVAARRPDDPEMLLVRSEIFKAEDHVDLAERDLLGAFRRSSDPRPAAEDLAQLYLDQDRPQKARDILEAAIERSSQKSSLLLTLARLEEMQGNNSAAENDYRRALAIDNNPENNRRLAQFLARSGNIADAKNTLMKLDAMSSGLGTATADLELESGQSEQAREAYGVAYERVLSQDSSRGENKAAINKLAARWIEAEIAGADSGGLQAAQLRLNEDGAKLDESSRSLLSAEIDLNSGNLAAAETESKAALTSNPAPAHYLLGMIASHRGQRADALMHWRSALNANESYVPARLALAASAIDDHDGKMAEEYVIDVVREEPANLQAILLYARALLLQGRFDSATALCQRAISVQPDGAEPSVILGEVALQQHRLALALLEFEKAMMLDPHSRTAIEGLTRVYQANGNASMPHKLETLALSGTPSSRLLEVAGRLYAASGRKQDAERCLRRASQMDPQRESAKIALAALYAKNLRQPELPISEQQPDPKSSEFSEQNSSALVAAFNAEQRNDQDEAIRSYESLIHAGDPTGIASNNLAWIYASQPRNLDRALHLALHALDLNPQSPQVLDTAGVIQLKRRHFTEAITLLQSGARKALELNENPELQHAIQDHLAQAKSLAGQPASHP